MFELILGGGTAASLALYLLAALLWPQRFRAPRPGKPALLLP